MLSACRASVLACLIVLSSTAGAEPVALRIAEAALAFDSVRGSPVVAVVLGQQSAIDFARFTQANVDRVVEFRIDGVVVMSPMIKQPIVGGQVQILVDRDLPELQQLVNRLNAGETAIEIEVVGEAP